MERCDVLVVGGGPAGSSCAWKLRRAGLDVVVIDRAAFPRDKPCAGWITPPVVTDLELDVEDYRRCRTFQPITGFLTGIIGGDEPTAVQYGRPVSYGIRRREFDEYLLRRSGARLLLGASAADVVRRDGRWIVNEQVSAPMLVGAGGHFCPIARRLNGSNRSAGTPLVLAQEMEFPIEPGDAPSIPIGPEVPELYFCRDMKGYGWCFRKQGFLNVGFGRLDPRSLPEGTSAFVKFLESRGRVPATLSWRWAGHAYLVHEPPYRKVVDAGVVLIGDAAGLARTQSGEGIRAAVESGLFAADTILEAAGSYDIDRLGSYERRLQERFGGGVVSRALSRLIPDPLKISAARALLRIPGFVRHVVIDQWFLGVGDPAADHFAGSKA
jgi:flavin-dependent dehydrogenase